MKYAASAELEITATGDTPEEAERKLDTVLEKLQELGAVVSGETGKNM